MKRITALVLALLMLASAAACAEQAEKDPVSTAGEVTAAETEPEEELDSLEARKLVSDELPDENFEGKAYRILSDKEYGKTDYFVEEMTGDVVEDAVFQRNADICARFDITIENQSVGYGDISGMVQRSVNANEDAYDIAAWHEIEAAKCASKKYFLNWYDIEYINCEKPWWTTASFKNLSIGGKTYLAVGAMNLYTMKSTYCMYLNKALAADYNVTDINDIVLNGEWTLDRNIQVITDSWNDLNGDGKQDAKDFWGLTTNSTSYATTYLYALGETTVSKDEDDIPYLDMNQEKFADMVNGVYKLLYETNGAYTTTGWDAMDVFYSNRALFGNCTFTAAFGKLREMDADYSIIPYPKWDENQEAYISMADGSAALMGVPMTNGDSRFVGIITEAVNAESWKSVLPAAYDIALKVKGSRDEESIGMIDMIFNNQVIDLGFIYADYSGLGFTMSNLMGSKDSNFASYYAKNEKAWTRKIEKLAKTFTED